MDRITPVIDFEAELGGLFDVKDKVAYLPGGRGHRLHQHRAGDDPGGRL